MGPAVVVFCCTRYFEAMGSVAILCYVLAGEVQWARRMVQQHHDEAAKKKVKIVHFCGFDSIPSDLGTAFMVNHIQETYGR